MKKEESSCRLHFRYFPKAQMHRDVRAQYAVFHTFTAPAKYMHPCILQSSYTFSKPQNQKNQGDPFCRDNVIIGDNDIESSEDCSQLNVHVPFSVRIKVI